MGSALPQSMLRLSNPYSQRFLLAVQASVRVKQANFSFTALKRRPPAIQDAPVHME